MAASSSSSASSSNSFNFPEIKYDVFISFRGEDIRTNFLSHLRKELRRNQIDFFLDDEKLHPGNEISSTLLRAIEQSYVSLVIFSEHYASSRWCMEELVKIIQCMKQYQRIVIPVFYNIDPSDVRRQKGTFAEAFDLHKEKYEQENMQRWRSVLKETANLCGIHYPSKYGNEAELIEDIVKVISKKLSHPFSYAPEDYIGINENFRFLQPLLAMESNEVRYVGIWGMGGIGKTTIARAIYARYASQFEGCCFLENATEKWHKSSLLCLYEEVVSELLEGEHLLVKGSAQARFEYVKRRLNRKKVLIVFDSVDAFEMLDFPNRNQIFLAPGSRVIVTSRDMQILIAARVHAIYEVRGLSFRSSLKLFCLNAFDKIYPENGYEKLSAMAVEYAKGIPLALKLLGSFLRLRSGEAWRSELAKLKAHPDSSIFNVLKLSYEGLDDSDKSIFLDIAFFFKGKDKDYVIKFADSCGFYGGIGIDNLHRKALITISRYNTIKMHDLIQQMGLEIVYKESPKDLKKRSRLRNPEDVRNVLENSEGEKSVEGIMCDLSRIGDVHLNKDTFKNMPHLRFLKLYAPQDKRPSNNVYVPTTLEPFSAKLRYLEWNGYPLNSLPSRFCAEKLVELRMPNSQISKLWDGIKNLPNLTVLDLNGCKKLVELPDLSQATKLKSINLKECESLCQLHPSISYIRTLEYLDIYGCKQLKSLKGNFKSPKALHAGNCSSLEEFSVSSSEELRTLNLSSSRIKNLPNEFCSFIFLGYLYLNDCRELIELPHNIKTLSRLRTLEIRGCCGLRSIPELPPSIQVFRADGCTSLETIFSLKAVFSLNRGIISFGNCMKLEKESLNDIMEDTHHTIFRNALLWLDYWSKGKYMLTNDHRFSSMVDIDSVYPGSEVPNWFSYVAADRSITIELDQPEDQLLGFYFCCVVSEKLSSSYFNKYGRVSIKCNYNLFNNGVKATFVSQAIYFLHERARGWNADHVLIWNSPLGNLLSNINRCRGTEGSDDDDDRTCNQKISFRFGFFRAEKEREECDEECYIKGCGVFPMYASTVVDAIRKLELEFNLNPSDHTTIPGINLDTLKRAMIRKSRGKLKLQNHDPFRGEDIRDNFLSHLRKEFHRNQIDFFVDDEKLHPGDEISSTLVRAIEESSISLIIFSKHYASSRWCMEELVKIIECMKQYQRIVIPVFYNIDPSDVRHQKRTFSEAFDIHKERYEEENMQNWRSILKEAANLSGIHYPSKYR
ncbi:hypothetical protein PIB30_033366 [Stylosanthes scabra]|uniref:ADP-ribosyl cyclase/cyclic ADP-ribose hydrolase n=1 Tax=Stylosanthes scabra TaxID=79078 RepID=A0ABU6YBB1_9FABA|nr:hypothetical protein [Stylosanthes scabra]